MSATQVGSTILHNILNVMARDKIDPNTINTLVEFGENLKREVKDTIYIILYEIIQSRT